MSFTVSGCKPLDVADCILSGETPLASTADCGGGELRIDKKLGQGVLKCGRRLFFLSISTRTFRIIMIIAKMLHLF